MSGINDREIQLAIAGGLPEAPALSSTSRPTGFRV